MKPGTDVRYEYECGESFLNVSGYLAKDKRGYCPTCNARLMRRVKLCTECPTEFTIHPRGLNKITCSDECEKIRLSRYNKYRRPGGKGDMKDLFDSVFDKRMWVIP